MLLPFGPVRNRELFSNYWLANRLALEPDWHELLPEAETALRKLQALWNQQRGRVEKYGKEAPLEKAFIQPVLEILGWKLFYQASLQGREPDYALFTTDESYDRALSAGYATQSFWQHASVVADAKAWHISLDRPHRVDGKKEYPPEQMEWYLDRAHVSWGFLTNGKLWRLVPRVTEGKPRFQTYLEVELPTVLDEVGDQVDIQGEHVRDFLFFYLLFSPGAFESRRSRAPLIQRALFGSSEYSIGVSEDLKERVFDALRLCISGFLSANGEALSANSDLQRCRENSFILLYRLLFIMYAEDRGLLPYRINDTYTQNRSLARLRDDVSQQLVRRGEQHFAKDGDILWKDINNLFDLVDAGHARYGVPAYNGGLFSSDQHPFLSQYAIGDRDLAQIIDKLSRALDPKNADAGLFRVDYRDLAITQLGAVYEGLLELRPRHATQTMIVIQATGEHRPIEKYHPIDKRIPKGFVDTGARVGAGSVYLETDKGDRRATGSYYTPDHIVDWIVQHALAPLCQTINDELRNQGNRAAARSAATTESPRLEGTFDDHVLQLNVLDPAMGSGHFLVRACQYLAEEIATNPLSADPSADELAGEDSALNYWKRRVAEECLFGVDVNPLAVELAKLALWLETASRTRPLEFLDHHLRCGNSLIGTKLSRLGTLPNAPPMFGNLVTDGFQNLRASLAEPVQRLRELRSDDVLSVKNKERVFRLYEIRVDELSTIADLWCRESFKAKADAPLTIERYEELLRLIGRSRRFKEQAADLAEGLAEFREKMRPFHWETEFPDVFLFQRDGVSPGFDAVIGNPPYEVIASKEVSTDLEPLKRFLRTQEEYAPSFVGKNNLYKLFICRAMDVLRFEGFLGFIVPMALLGDENAVGIRKLILSAGAFTEIDAFPQKDDAHKRVFPDAKLSTAVIGAQKTENGEKRAAPFVVRRHPERWFVSNVQGLFIGPQEVAQYDPSNMTIVTCSQEAWRLAVRLLQHPNFRRLGEYCTSFQGEVNETTDGALLSTKEQAGPLILRGANISLYAVREASQGEPYYLKREEFIHAKAKSEKLRYTVERRIGFQRSSPQNNFRRLIAAPVSANEFCFDTVSYVPESKTRLPLAVVLGLLNSKLLEWFFRLGSSNSKVNEYQFNNLPCPIFDAKTASRHAEIMVDIDEVLQNGNSVEDIWRVLDAAHLFAPPFTRTTETALSRMVARISNIESMRGDVRKLARSKMAPASQGIQDALDRLLFRMAGFSAEEVQSIERSISILI